MPTTGPSHGTARKRFDVLYHDIDSMPLRANDSTAFVDLLVGGNYQITLGGSSTGDASIGRIIGPAFGVAEVVDAVETIVLAWLDRRQGDERFLDTLRRVGHAPFREALYGKAGSTGT